MVIYNTSYLMIEYDELLPCLMVTWKGYTSSEDFRNGLDRIFQAMQEYKVDKTLTDIREHKVIGIEDQNYAAAKSIEFDKTYWNVRRALIIPQDVFAKFAIKNVNNATMEQGQEREMFTNIEDAKDWLRKF